MNNQNGFLSIVVGVILLIVVIAGGAYYLGTKNAKPDVQITSQYSPSPVSNAVLTTAPTTYEAPHTTSSATTPTAQGATLEEIKYTLPPTWSAKIDNNNLILSANGGGYLSIKTYKYPGTTGRREFYCSLESACIEGTSYFDAMRIGNIDGYSANALDNSGGGIEYFGAKGNVFYVISSYGPPSPSEFENTYLDVMNSLFF